MTRCPLSLQYEIISKTRGCMKGSPQPVRVISSPLSSLSTTLVKSSHYICSSSIPKSSRWHMGQSILHRLVISICTCLGRSGILYLKRLMVSLISGKGLFIKYLSNKVGYQPFKKHFTSKKSMQYKFFWVSGFSMVSFLTYTLFGISNRKLKHSVDFNRVLESIKNNKFRGEPFTNLKGFT